LNLQIRNPPRVYFRKLADSSSCSDDLSEILNSLWFYYKGEKEEPWVRTTDFTPTASIGQSWHYLLRCPSGVSTKTKNDILSKLAGYRLTSHPSTPRRLVLHTHTEANPNVTSQTLVPIVDAPIDTNIAFDAMFLLNVLVQAGYIVPASLTGAFWYLLHVTPVEYVKLALRDIWSSNDVCYDPADWIQRVVQKYRRRGTQILNAGSSIKLEAGLFNVHRLYITPTKVYCHGPEIDMSNRVTRKHGDKIDNFIRVSFVDEDWESISAGALYSGVGKERSPVYDRILSVMREGVMLAGKRYEFLAFSSSQLREQSFWMFASDDDITPHSIRAWMGDFLNIRNVALCAARMGQCFSTSTPTLEVSRDEVEDIPDVARVDPQTGIMYNFSDGIGKISKELADKVTRKCGFRRMGIALTPSAFQIRYGGFKGVVAIDPFSDKKLSLRPSMDKFPSSHIGLEILSWSKFLPCYLNRQVISLLSTLGVPDLVFERMQASVLTQLNAMLNDSVAALEILQVWLTSTKIILGRSYKKPVNVCNLSSTEVI
jgi:RNA-dependent RNA polymerase